MSAVFGFCLFGPMMLILIIRIMIAAKMIMVVMMVIVISIVRLQGSENHCFVICLVQFCSLRHYSFLRYNLQDISDKQRDVGGILKEEMVFLLFLLVGSVQLQVSLIISLKFFCFDFLFCRSFLPRCYHCKSCQH